MEEKKDFLGKKKIGTCKVCKEKFYTSMLDTLRNFICPKCSNEQENPDENSDTTEEIRESESNQDSE